MTVFTEEQRRIIASRADLLVVNAFAGTGKTSTLVGFAAERPSARMLYLAFNKSVAEEAKGRFPANVECKTSHALAFPRFGSRYLRKLGNPRPFHARNYLRPKLGSDDALVFAALALEVVNRFLISSLDKLTLSHVQQVVAGSKSFAPTLLFDAATRLWDAMCDPDNAAVPMPHDGYLKLYQASAPDLSRYDYILLDEAQDTNPCLFSIFMAQQTKKVLVGDEHQNIYTFRGAMNAMRRTRGNAERHALTASFRFGENVANVANAILAIFKGEGLRLRGLGAAGTVSSLKDGLGTAFLHRTNAGLFDCAAQLIGQVSNDTSKALHFVGGVKGYNFDTISDVWRLKDGDLGAVRDPFLRSFPSYSGLVDYADAVEDRELHARIKVVEKYTFRVPRLVERLTALHREDLSSCEAPYYLTTAHKSKGLEWDQVVLGEDFPAVMDDGRPLARGFVSESSEKKPLSTEDANLLYVASTRARKGLVLNRSVEELMEWVGKHGIPDVAHIDDPELVA